MSRPKTVSTPSYQGRCWVVGKGGRRVSSDNEKSLAGTIKPSCWGRVTTERGASSEFGVRPEAAFQDCPLRPIVDGGDRAESGIVISPAYEK